MIRTMVTIRTQDKSRSRSTKIQSVINITAVMTVALELRIIEMLAAGTLYSMAGRDGLLTPNWRHQSLQEDRIPAVLQVTKYRHLGLQVLEIG